MKYVVLLRGINVGGRRKVAMAQLCQCLENLGSKNVRTLLNSGNVVFESGAAGQQELVAKIQSSLRQTFGFEIPVLLRTGEELQKIIEAEPFSSVKLGDTRQLYVHFYPQKLSNNLELPCESPKHDFKILSKTEREIFSLLLSSPSASTLDLMTFVEKEFGKSGTTRNFNTVQKLAVL